MDIDNYNEEIQEFFERGKNKNYLYMVVMEDTMDYEDWPHYSNSLEECDEYIANHHGQNMQRFLSLFDLTTGDKLKGI